MSTEKSKRPNIFTATDYREFLRDYYEFEKAKSEGFSYRTFSKLAGFKSPNFLKLVIDGQRNLTLESIRKISFACKMSNEECDHFRQLVQLHQADTPTEKTKAVREMMRSQVFRALYPLKEAELDYYENWISIPIREMVSSPSFREDSKWISKKLRGKGTPEQVTEAIQNMLKLGLLKRDFKGRLEQATRDVSTGHEIPSPTVALFHQQMIQMASDSIVAIKRHEREISSSTVLISEKTFNHLKELMQNFRRAILAEADPSGTAGGTVYQINFQLFPITESLESEGPPEEKCKSA